MSFYQLIRKQELPASVEEIWSFISTPKNLREITPAYMDFVITSNHLPDKMYAGMMIAYTVRPVLGIKISWLTEITHIVENHYFVDEQRIGPYTLWHHEHFVAPSKQGVVMTDIVTYKLPFGILGRMAHYFFVKKQLKGIFDYRETAMKDRFK